VEKRKTCKNRSRQEEKTCEKTMKNDVNHVEKEPEQRK
jgi:hypothetical protein